MERNSNRVGKREKIKEMRKDGQGEGGKREI